MFVQRSEFNSGQRTALYKKKDVFCRHNQVFVATKIWGNVGGKKVGFL